jgi:hypothetical protein
VRRLLGLILVLLPTTVFADAEWNGNYRPIYGERIALLRYIPILPQISITSPSSSFAGGAITSPILAANGSAAAPSYSFTNSTNSGLFTRIAGTTLDLSIAGSTQLEYFSSGLRLANVILLGWTNSDATAGADTGLARAAAGILEVNNGSAGGNGWILQRAARIGLAADYTNATASLSATTLSVTLIAGRKYNFIVELFFQESTAVDGAQIAFDGGAATVTNFRVHSELFNQAPTLLASTAATALATTHAIASTVVTTQCHWRFSGTFEVNVGGTFIIRAAQNAHTTGTLTIDRGSFMWIEDMVYN